MKILVTGASGFIGRNFVRLCLARGHQVRALYRRERLDDELQSLASANPAGLEFLRADLSFPDSIPDLSRSDMKQWCQAARTGIPDTAPDWEVAPSDLARARTLLDGCDMVVHIAALALDWGPFERFFAANVNPLQVLAKAALALDHAPGFVLVSSIAVHGFGPHQRSTEAGPYYRAVNPYQVSKRLAEALAARLAGQGLRLATFRPGNVYGPGDTTTFFPILDALDQGIMGTLGGGRHLTCPVHVEDLCQALYAGMTRLAAGTLGGNATFNITHTGQTTWKELLDLACQCLDRPARYPNLPAFLAWTAAALLEGSFRLLRIKSAPPLTFYRISQLLNHYDFDPRRAMTELDWRPLHELGPGMAGCTGSWKASKSTSAAR